jgi:hypothetical protein
VKRETAGIHCWVVKMTDFENMATFDQLQDSHFQNAL